MTMQAPPAARSFAHSASASTQALFRNPHEDDGKPRTAARIQDQRQPVTQNATVLAPQLLVLGQHTAFGPMGGKLDAPRPPCGSEVSTMRRRVRLGHQLGEFDTTRARSARSRGLDLRRRLQSLGLGRVARDDADVGLRIARQDRRPASHASTRPGPAL